MLNKLKSLLLDDTIYMAFLLVLVGIVAFGLGRMSVTMTSNQAANVVGSRVSLQPNPQLPIISTSSSTSTSENVTTQDVVVSAAQKFVASKSGTKYHAMTCPGAKQIKESNKIFFPDEQSAEAAGYTKAANCKF